MEPITHFLSGACLSRAGFNRKTALATATLTLAAEAPDLDSFYSLGGDVTGFQHHRGWTHTLLGAPVLALLVVALVYAWYRWRVSRGKWKHESPPRWGWLIADAVLASWLHILLDFTNNYGVRPFMPFSYRWYSWDIVFIVEPLLWLFLGGALLAPLLFGLIDSEVGARRKRFRGRGWAIAGLVLMVALWAFRDFEHRRAVTALQSVTYSGRDATRVSAFPYPVNPFRWYGVVETSAFYEGLPINSLRGEVDPQESERKWWKSPQTPAILAAKESRLGRVYLDWAQYPVTQLVPASEPNQGALVRLFDVRFTYPEGRSALGAWVKLNAQDRVVDEGFDRHSVRPTK